LAGLIKLRVVETAVNLAKSQDFHPISTVKLVLSLRGDGALPLQGVQPNSLQRTRKRSPTSTQAVKIPAHAEAEDTSKIKDRLEALLFAETLQGTLSPNANPR